MKYISKQNKNLRQVVSDLRECGFDLEERRAFIDNYNRKEQYGQLAMLLGPIAVIPFFTISQRAAITAMSIFPFAIYLYSQAAKNCELLKEVKAKAEIQRNIRNGNYASEQSGLDVLHKEIRGENHILYR